MKIKTKVLWVAVVAILPIFNSCKSKKVLTENVTEKNVAIDSQQAFLDQQVELNVIDVGVGQCIVVKFPDDKYIIYDAGNHAGSGETTYKQIKELVPVGSEIEFLILSHTDGDHIGAAGQIINNYRVKEVVSTGLEKSMITSQNPTKSYDRLIAALTNKPPHLNYTNLNQVDSTITPGLTFEIGDAKVIFLCGWGKPPTEWNLTSPSKKLNSVSIVVKIEYKGNSVLLCGDAVGREDNAPDNSIIASEKFLLANALNYLSSNVIVAPHHGADNASSTAFITAVNPSYVIFSAGHKHEHPRASAAKRYLRLVGDNKIYRTDRGDDEGQKEYAVGRIDGCKDKRGDDDIVIKLHSDQSYTVAYVNSDNTCE